MADKQVDIRSTEDSTAIGDSAGNLVTVTGNKLDVNATLAAGGTVTAKIQDSAGNTLNSTSNALHALIKNVALEIAEGPNTPNLHFIFTYVQAGDIGADYVNGSQGMCKTMKIFPMGAAGGTPAKLSTYKYQDGTQPNGVTDAVETTSTV